MNDYMLEPDESIIIKKDVYVDSPGLSFASHEFVLTDRNIIIVTKGARNTVRDLRKYRLSDFKTYGNNPSIIADFNSLELYFHNDSLKMQFLSRREARRIKDAIEKVYNNEEVSVTDKGSNALPGTELVAETVRDTFDTVKGTLGIDRKMPFLKEQTVNKKCPFCGAPLSGTRNRKVKCSYCDTEQVL